MGRRAGWRRGGPGKSPEPQPQRPLALLPHLLHEPARVALKRLPLAMKGGDDECIRALTQQEPGNEDKTAGGSEARSPHRERPGGELIQRQQRLAFH